MSTLKTQKLPPDIEETINTLRRQLGEHKLAFGALFVAAQDKAYSMLVVAEELPIYLRCFLLADLISNAKLLLDTYQQ
jgi:hypothetical protein